MPVALIIILNDFQASQYTKEYKSLMPVWHSSQVHEIVTANPRSAASDPHFFFLWRFLMEIDH
jgi:hypothetical protein